MGRLMDRKRVCNLCKREVGMHGWSRTGMIAVHNCPHGKRCKASRERIGPDCNECHGGRRWGFRDAA